MSISDADRHMNLRRAERLQEALSQTATTLAGRYVSVRVVVDPRQTYGSGVTNTLYQSWRVGVHNPQDNVAYVDSYIGKELVGNLKGRSAQRAVDTYTSYCPMLVIMHVPFDADQPAMINDPDVLDSVVGSFYHELAHLWFTPATDRLTTNDKAIHDRTYTLLEDNRIESHTVVSYPGLATYYRKNTYDALRSAVQVNDDVRRSAYLSVAGRQFIDPEVRQALRDEFELPDQLDEVDDIFAKYNQLHTRHLKTQAGKNQAVQLARRLQAVIDQLTTPPPSGHSDANGGSSTNSKRGINQHSAGQDQTDDQMDADGAQGVDQGLDNFDQTEGSAGAGKQQTGQLGNDPLKNMLDQASKHERNTEQHAGDRDDMQNSMRSSMAGKENYDIAEPQERGVTPAMAQQANLFAQDLTQILSPDVDPGWYHDQSSGRLNVQRYMTNPDDIDSMFDRWADGAHEAFDIHAVIASDMSSSMLGKPVEKSLQGMWIIRRAIEQNDGEVLSLAYNAASKPRELYANGPARSHTYEFIGANGGTAPLSTIVASMEWIVQRPQQSLRVIFILTDGEWDDARSCAALLNDLQRQGIYIVFVQIGDVMLSEYNVLSYFKPDVFAELQNADDFANVARDFLHHTYVARKAALA